MQKCWFWTGAPSINPIDTVDICYLFIWVRFSHSNNNIARISSNNLKANLLICALYLILNISEPILINSLCSIQLLLIIRNFQFLTKNNPISYCLASTLNTYPSLFLALLAALSLNKSLNPLFIFYVWSFKIDCICLGVSE